MCIVSLKSLSAVSGEDLTEQQDTLDQENASQTSHSERVDPTEDPQHTEPEDIVGSCDASQQRSNLCDNQQDDNKIVDKEGK
jgi:hypothetical protein